LTGAAPAKIGQCQGACNLARVKNLGVEQFADQTVMVAPNIKHLRNVAF